MNKPPFQSRRSLHGDLPTGEIPSLKDDNDGLRVSRSNPFDFPKRSEVHREKQESPGIGKFAFSEETIETGSLYHPEGEAIEYRNSETFETSLPSVIDDEDLAEPVYYEPLVEEVPENSYSIREEESIDGAKSFVNDNPFESFFAPPVKVERETVEESIVEDNRSESIVSASGFERLNDSDVKVSQIMEHEVIDDEDETVEVYGFDEVFKNPKKSSNLKRLLPWGILALVAIVGMIVGGVIFYKSSFVAVPSALATVDENSTDMVCDVFTEVDLSCDAHWDYSDASLGTLMFQSVAPGESIKKGSLVEITYSKGPEQIEVPVVEGLSLSDAEALIKDSGLVIGQITEEDAEGLDAGVVIRSSIEPGETVSNGTAIDLVISSGLYIVPDWVGKPTEVVVIEAAEIGVEVVYLEQEDAGPAGIILAQSIEPGTETKERVIEVTVSKSAIIDSLEVIDAIGKTSEEAQVAFAEAGFTKLKIVEVPSTAAPGVFQTVPGAGQTVASSETIVIIVATPEN